MKTSMLLFLLSAFLLAAPAASQQIWIIKPDGTGDAPTIQAGIDSASAGDVVLVECGTYYERDIHMKDGVRLHSWANSPDCVTIDAGGDDRVFYCADLSNATRIEGFTITHGHAPTFPYYGSRGSGMFLLRSSLTIANCVFVWNHALLGEPWAGYGGGLYCEDSSPTLTACTFSLNTANTGGGMYAIESSPNLIDCVFIENVIGLVSRNSSLTLTGCVFSGNYGALSGSALSCTGNATINNCTFVGNYGGILYYEGETDVSFLLANSIIAFGLYGEAVGISGYPGCATFACNNIYGNAGGDWVGEIAGQDSINGNFSLNPLFCDIASDDYSLMQCSPCAPGNHPHGADCGLIGALPVGCQGTAIERTTWGRIKTMFR